MCVCNEKSGGEYVKCVMNKRVRKMHFYFIVMTKRMYESVRVINKRGGERVCVVCVCVCVCE